MKLKANGKEAEKTKTLHSPGFLLSDRRILFEQVSEGDYIVYDLIEGKFLIDPNGPSRQFYDEDRDINYAPLPRVPWPVAKPKLQFSLDQTNQLWQEVRQFILHHIDIMDHELYDVLTAWAFATYLQEVWVVIPYLFFYGPVACGKTRALETLQQISYRGIIGSNVSASSLFRGLEQWHPTVFLDETEIYNRTEHIEVIGLLNSGYRRGQYAWRVKTTDKGSELELFDVFGFKALSGTEGLAKALESRSIMVRMIKNMRSVRFLLDTEGAEDIRGKLLMWRLLMFRRLFGEGSEGSEPFLNMPSDLDFASGRLIELFQPLLAVSNDGRENIVKYAKKIHEIRQLEEATGVEALILESLLRSEQTTENNVVLTKEITETLNLGLSDKDKFKQPTVGRIMRRLGFLPRHTRQGNGWFWDNERIKLLKAWYLPEQTNPENHSQPSPPSQLLTQKDTELTICHSQDSLESDTQTPVQIELETSEKRIIKPSLEPKVKLDDFKSVHWSDGFYDWHDCAVCGSTKLTSWQAETFKDEKLWLCEDCKAAWEKERMVTG
jgi:hypothetical protein